MGESKGFSVGSGQVIGICSVQYLKYILKAIFMIVSLYNVMEGEKVSYTLATQRMEYQWMDLKGGELIFV